MTIKQVPSDQRDKKNCLSIQKNESGPDSLFLTLPSNFNDFQFKDIPFVVTQINEATLDENLPETASSRELSTYLYSLISYLELIGESALADQYQSLYRS